MKTAGKILALIFISFFLSNCENSQGYDPYATITPIFPDNPGIDTIGNSPQTEFEPDSVQFVFLETFRTLGMGSRNKSIIWNWKNLRKVIIIDTANTVTKLYVKMSVDSRESRPYYNIRADWVNSFEISFGAILDEEYYRLNNGNSDSKRWFRINIFRNIDDKIMSYGPTQASGQVFINELNSDKGIINGTVVIDLTNVSKKMRHHLQLQRFKCNFMIFY